jgi:hypothetical protein
MFITKNNKINICCKQLSTRNQFVGNFSKVVGCSCKENEVKRALYTISISQKRSQGERKMIPEIEILELSETRKNELGAYPYEIDWQLVRECGYFPRPTSYVYGRVGCICGSCSFDHPNFECERAHILVDTRIGENKWHKLVKTLFREE